MERMKVRSSNLDSVEYNRDTKTLEVRFLNGAVYQYFRVPEHVHRGLMDATSKGEYLDQIVKKGGYQYKRIH